MKKEISERVIHRHGAAVRQMNSCTISSIIETFLELSISKYEEIIIQKVEVVVAFTKIKNF